MRNRQMRERLSRVWWNALGPVILPILWVTLPSVRDFEFSLYYLGTLEPAMEIVIRQLVPAIMTVAICIPGARRDGFEPSTVRNIYLFAFIWGIASAIFPNVLLRGISIAPWIGCVLVGVHQALFLFSPLRDRVMSRGLVEEMNRLSYVQIGSAILCLLTFGFIYTFYTGREGWVAYTSVLAYQLFAVTLIALPVIRTQWFNSRCLVAFHLVPSVFFWTADLQRLWLPHQFRWEGRDCFADLLRACEVYTLGGPIPEPHHWAILAVAVYAGVCGLHWTIRRMVAGSR